ncbi:hypothetical protein KFE25_007986 [Diacronema lutheri]|uniref:N-acetylgalactosaminide beta-1,3-galactosyltransferase n=2 Tax=Diacronema lutheri TaxID=2081491 RepID=A0A8J5XQM5_DIALT|nr:hypothetical protein KFE25_007986 [Diacronema lutheri]
MGERRRERLRLVVALLLASQGVLHAKIHPLRLSEIHFVVMSSDEVMERAIYANHTWCSYAEARCIFATPKQICSQAYGGCLKAIIVSGRAPSNCCAQRDFFCKAHRAETLSAQYRFLPALLEYRKRPEFAEAKWVVLVDDDAFVFVENLRRLLEHYPPHVPFYMGEFLEGRGPQSWAFACGGGGSVFSRAAMERMDLRACIKRIHSKCMQSDWMLAECAHQHMVRYVKAHGCNSCSHITRKGAHSILHTRVPNCHFMQQSALFIPYLQPATRGSPSIIHGQRSEADYKQLDEWFKRTNRTDGSWLDPRPQVNGAGGEQHMVTWQPHGAGAAAQGLQHGAWTTTTRGSRERPAAASGGGNPQSGVWFGVARASKGGSTSLASTLHDVETLHSMNARDQDEELAARKPF